MLTYDAPLYRPPAEAGNLIVQATLGCSFNACAFCSMYKEKTYTVRPLRDVQADIDQAAADWPQANRVFLADGDALALPTAHLAAILDHLAWRLPELTRVSCYATPANLNKKSPEELALLRAKKLSLVYVGIESGSNRVLKVIHKGSAEATERALLRAHEANIKVSATVILGLGGESLWREHIEQTAALLNRAPVRYLSTLCLYLDEISQPAFTAAFDGTYTARDDRGLLEEMALLIDTLSPPNPLIFRSNHSSNRLALAGTLPKDRNALREKIASCIRE